MTKRGIIRILLMITAFNLVAYYYGQTPVERLVYFSIAIFVFFAITDLLFPGKSIIAIENNAVTFTSNGMVTANFDLDEVEKVELSNEMCQKFLLVNTKDGLKFGISTSGYSDADVEKIIRALEKA